VLFAASPEVAVRTVTLPNLLLFRWCLCLLVLFRLLLIALALIERKVNWSHMATHGN